MIHNGFSPRATRSMLSKELRNAFSSSPSRPRHMRRQDDVWQGEELVLGGRRLLDHDIELGPLDPVGDQRIIERVRIDHRTPAGVDQDR